MPAVRADKESVFHSRFNRVLAVISWALIAFLALSGAIAGAITMRPALGVAAIFSALVVYALLWRPSVSVDDQSVTLVNVMRTVVVPWSALIDVDTKYSLSLVVPGREFAAWAAPAPGRTAATLARRSDARLGNRAVARGLAHRSRPGDLTNTESGEAAYLVRERWNTLREEGRIEGGVAESTPITIRWHFVQLALLAVTAVVAIGGVQLH